MNKFLKYIEVGVLPLPSNFNQTEFIDTFVEKVNASEIHHMTANALMGFREGTRHFRNFMYHPHAKRHKIGPVRYTRMVNLLKFLEDQ